MKARIINKQKTFSPIELTLTITSQVELDAIKILGSVLTENDIDIADATAKIALVELVEEIDDALAGGGYYS